MTWQTVLYYNANPLDLYLACRPIARFFLPAGQSKKLCGSNALDSRTRQRHSKFLAHTNLLLQLRFFHACLFLH